MVKNNGVSPQAGPGWRLWLVFPLIFVGCCAILFVSVLRELLGDIHHALMTVLEWLIDWARGATANAQTGGSNG